MGQKVHPIGFRLGTIKDWESSWFTKTSYAENLHEDFKLRKFIKKDLYHAGITTILLERKGNQLKINIFAAKPGIVIGKRGQEVDRLKKELHAMLPGRDIFLNIKEVRKPELSAQLVAENIALQLERRVAFRRAMKKSVGLTIKFGAKGIRINCAGRLGGAEIARTEWHREGRVPLHTIRANIDYGFAEASTTFGLIGIKVWIYLGDQFFGKELRRLEEQKKLRDQIKVEEAVEAAVAEVETKNTPASQDDDNK
jgi:small subunit ribosomal protein S3|tara:strand:- start:220736 stop:221497 length:762 start_codon:yes stop_codon:yes gene_type:complete